MSTHICEPPMGMSGDALHQARQEGDDHWPPPHPRLPRPVAYARLRLRPVRGQSIGFERADAVQCLVGGHPDRVDQDRGARPLSRCSKKEPRGTQGSFRSNVGLQGSHSPSRAAGQ